MKLVVDGYANVYFEKYHIATKITEGDGINNLYLATEHIKEVRALLKVSKLSGNAAYRMVESINNSYGFMWEQIR